MRKAVFTIWATPHFELEEAKRVAEGFNECAEHPIQYDEVYDQFYILDEEGIKHLYGIGAYSWTWDRIANCDIYWLAQGIEDFIYEFDT